MSQLWRREKYFMPSVTTSSRLQEERGGGFLFECLTLSVIPNKACARVVVARKRRDARTGQKSILWRIAAVDHVDAFMNLGTPDGPPAG
jgi:hypothetical protein